MTRRMLRAKVHRIAVTEREVEYEGSLTLDSELMRAGDFKPYEAIDVYDVTNGQRFSTYLIEGPAGSGACCVNGAAARLVEKGDKLILASFCQVEERQVDDWRPTLVVIGDDNAIREVKQDEGAGVRVPS